MKVFLMLIICIVFTGGGCSQSIDDTNDSKEPLTDYELKIENAAIPMIGKNDNMLISTYGESVRLECNVLNSDDCFTYKWFLFSSDEKILIEDAIDCYYETGELEKGIYHYCCEVKNTIPDNGDGGTKISIQNVDFYVAYTGLPTLIISTDKKITSKEEKINGKLILKAKGLKEDYEDLEIDMKINGRGNSSWNGAEKKSYNIKLDDKKQLLGMGKSKKWALIANYFDKSLLRNSYAEYLSKNVFSNLAWNPSYVHVDVVINGEYNGNYILAERIKIEDTRLDIQDISKTADIHEGGFLCEINERFDEAYNFRTNHGIYIPTQSEGVAISLKDPDEVSVVIQEEIKKIVQLAEDALFSEKFSDCEIGYENYFDINSLVDWYIMHELVRMQDACWFRTSAYFFYNPNDKKIHMGPCWDYDLGFGNVPENQNLIPQGFDCKIHSQWYIRLFEDRRFVTFVQERFNEIFDDLNNSVQYLSDVSKDIDISANYNFLKWNILGVQTGLNPAGWETRMTYKSEVDFLESWYLQRLSWLKDALNEL